MSNVRRFVIGAGLFLAVLPASPAFGYGGDNHIPAIALSASVVVPGGTLVVVGQDFSATGAVKLTLHSAVVDLGTVHADADGQFEAEVTIPSDVPPGVHMLRALDVPTGNLVFATVTVQGIVEPTPPGGGLAGTGVAVAGLGGLGVLLVLGGQALMVAGRRRKTPA